MTSLFKEILSMSLSGSLLILIILMIKPVLKERFSKAWHYYIWIIVFFRLLLPFSPEFGVVDNLFKDIPAEATYSIQPASGNSSLSGNNNEISTVEGGQVDSDSSVVTPDTNNKLSDYWQISGWLWLAGMILLFIIKTIRYIHFIILMHNSSEPVSDKKILYLYERVAKELKIHNRPMLKISNCLASPVLTGICKPIIYLTENTLSWEETSLYYVLRHELMHYKRQDLMYKWCCDLIICVHWFNPMVYIMNRRINIQCEVSCDEAVARDLSKEEKLAYGTVLITAVSENRKNYYPILSSSLYEDKKSIKMRMEAIIMSKQSSKKTIIISTIVTIILCIASFWLGAYTMNGRDLINKANSATGNNSANSGGSTDSPEGSAVDTATDTPTAAPADTSSNTPTDAATDTSENTPTDTPASDTTPAQTDNNTSSPSDSGSVLLYSNTDFGFDITLPASWKGYKVINDTWEGNALSGDQAGQVIESGTKLIIRHPDWTEENPRQDIPIMIFTKEQWDLVEKEDIGVSAAPIGPSELGRNSKYVFALPPRYNFAYAAGYEEVETIVENNSLVANESYK